MLFFPQHLTSHSHSTLFHCSEKVGTDLPSRAFPIFTSCSSLCSDIIFHGHPVGKAPKTPCWNAGRGLRAPLGLPLLFPITSQLPIKGTHGAPRGAEFRFYHSTQKYFLSSSALLFYSLHCYFIHYLFTLTFIHSSIHSFSKNLLSTSCEYLALNYVWPDFNTNLIMLEFSV